MQRCRHDLVTCLLRADRPAASHAIQSAIDAGCEPNQLLLSVIQPAMQQIGERWTRQQASLTQYFVAGKIADDVTDLVIPLLERRAVATSHVRVVIGTIAGDYHGLGRKIVAAFLRAAGMVVVDLGLSVEPERFVSAACQETAQVVAVSALMVHSVEQIKVVRSLLEETCPEARLIVGGAPFNYDRRLYLQVGAHATARNAGEAVRVVESLVDGLPRR